MGAKQVLRNLSDWKNPLIVLLLPLILSPIVIIGQTPVARCAYAVIIIGAFWVLEVMPIAVTSLMPIFMFPMLGIMASGDVCVNYANDTLMLFFGSLIVAAAVERWNLHRRIALRALTLVGPEPRWLMLGIMLPTWFLSMWMSNTATTAMMIPILNAILSQIRDVKDKVSDDDHQSEKLTNGEIPAKTVKVTIEMDDILEPGHPVSPLVRENRTGDGNAVRDKDREFDQLAKTFALCTAYAANAGGIATLTGTPPNIILKGQVDILYDKYGVDSAVTFANWLVVGLPISTIVFLFTWIWLQVYALKKKCLCCVRNDEDNSRVKTHLLHEYRSLGPMSFAEKIVLADFVMLAFLWVSRNPVFIPGWGSLFPDKYIKDSVPAIFMSVILFILPCELPGSKKRSKDDITTTSSYVPLLNWKYVNDKMAWGVLLLIGGGFAVADGCRVSGLSLWLSEKLTVFSVLPTWLFSSLLAYITAAITNITSNAATATLFLPIVGNLAIRLSIHPLMFMIPCAVAASFAYLLPVGTPPNAIVFSTGYLKIPDMIKAGSVINFGSVLILCFALNTFVIPVYDLTNIPEGFLNKDNVSIATEVVNILNGTAYNVTNLVT